MTEQTATDIDKALIDDHDSAWKEIMEKLFEPFMGFFFPRLHKDINFALPITFMNDELRQIDPDNKLGKRIADALVKVHLKDGKSECIWVVIHVEIEGNPRKQFMERMFIYYYRIYDRLKEKNMEIVSLGILIDNEKNFRPDNFTVGRWGFKLIMKIPLIKITDYLWVESKRKKLEKSKSPIAMVLRAQLKCMAIKGTPAEQRYAVKRELLRECRRHNYGPDATRALFRFIGWIIRIPDELEKKLIQDVNHLEEVKDMEYAQYVPIWEKKAWDEGVAVGIEKEKIDTAIRLIQKSVDLNLIAIATELPFEKIEKLALEGQIDQTAQ